MGPTGLKSNIQNLCVYMIHASLAKTQTDWKCNGVWKLAGVAVLTNAQVDIKPKLV
jgi:hypothetical protein